MEIPIILEPDGGGWRARCRHPVEASAKGETRHEATRALELILCGSIGESFTLLPLEAAPDKPWIATAGAIPDDETTEAWLDAVAEYRRQRDADDRRTVSPPPAQTTP